MAILNKQMAWLILLLLGMTYFTTISSLEINYLYKSLLFMLPIQMGSVIYMTYRRWSH
ncbi:MAG: hypothetical protein RLZZ507_1131 [Cyanobacteriota bacterium]|jgi:hypothetical protein